MQASLENIYSLFEPLKLLAPQRRIARKMKVESVEPLDNFLEFDLDAVSFFLQPSQGYLWSPFSQNRAQPFG